MDKLCWRLDTQLIRRPASSWFIRVAGSVPEILGELDSTTWVPSFCKEEAVRELDPGVHDWNVSKDHYWRKPLPLYASRDFEEVVCAGCVAELRDLVGFAGPLRDIHKHKVDQTTIPSRQAKDTLRSVDEVFDCCYITHY